MKQFTFTLKRMKDYKDQVLDTEKNTLGRLRADRERLEQRIEALLADYEDLNAELVRRTLEGITVPEMRSYRFQLENIHVQVKDLRSAVERIQARIERQVQVVVAASQEVAGLDKLEEKQREEYQRLVAKDEEQVIAEFVSQKLVREKTASGL